MQKMIVKKPWGTYEVLLDEPNYKVKRIVVHPYERFSLQYHKHREEHWVVVEGDGIVQVNETESPAYVRPHWVILPTYKHRASAGQNGLETALSNTSRPSSSNIFSANISGKPRNEEAPASLTLSPT